MSTAADKIRQAADGMVTQEQRIAENSQKAMDASNKQSRVALDATIAASRLDQRAWVGFLDATPGEFSETAGVPINVTFVNSGRTPARNVQFSSGYIVSDIAISEPSPQSINLLVFRPTQSIPPQGKYSDWLGLMIPAGSTSLPTQLKGFRDVLARFQFIKAKTHVLYYYGILKYDDVFRNHRTTEYCIFLADPDAKRIGICDSFNDLN